MQMNVKERALRFALDFFEDEAKWEHENPSGMGFEGALCVGMALVKGRAIFCHKPNEPEWDNKWLNDVMQMAPDGGAEVATWNDDVCPDIAALAQSGTAKCWRRVNQTLWWPSQGVAVLLIWCRSQ